MFKENFSPESVKREPVEEKSKLIEPNYAFLKQLKNQSREVSPDTLTIYAEALKYERQFGAKEHTDFADVYSAEELNRDTEYLNRLETQFADQLNRLPPAEKKLKLENNMLASGLEAVLFDMCEREEWFGGEVIMAKTSRFDDVANGVDLVAEFAGEDETVERTGLAIDASFSQDLGGKFARIKQAIDRGKMSEVKYFQSKYDPEFRGRLKNLPRVVIGCER